MRCYLPLIWKDSVSHIYGLVVYVKEGRPFARDLSSENSKGSYSFDSLYFIWRLTSVYSMKHHLPLWVQLLILFHLTLMMFSQSTHLLMYWSIETLTFIIRTVKPILVELCYNVSISNDPTQINSPTRIHNCYYHSPAHLDYFFPLNLIFTLQYLSLCWKIQIMLFSQFPLDVLQTQNKMPHFIV